MNFTDFVVPLFFGVVLVGGFFKKVPLYDAFVEGATEGLKTALRIAPYLLAMIVVIGMLRASGALSMITFAMQTPAHFLGIPEETVPLALLRPLSGSGALGLLQEIFNRYGPDSIEGLTASTIMGASDTVFYLLALYFGSVKISKTRYTLLSALLATLSGTITAALVCRLVFGG